MVRPLYAARLEDLGPDDRVKVERACGHLEYLTGAMLATPRLSPYTPALDLKRRLNVELAGGKGGQRYRLKLGNSK